MRNVLAGVVILFFISVCVSMKPIDRKELMKEEIIVEVKGAVKNPGLFECPAYSMITDLFPMIQFEEDADLSMLNLQAILKDKDILVIARKEEIPLISINTASLQTLCTLEGIGEATAQAIIDYRRNKGFFRKLEDLMNVKGVGQKKFEKIRDKICL